MRHARLRIPARAGAVVLAAAGLLLCVLAGTAPADERPTVLVTDPRASAYRAAVQRFREAGPSPDPVRPGRFRAALVRALEFSGVFEILDPASYLGGQETGALTGRPACEPWRAIRADALVAGEIRALPTGLEVEFRTLDVGRCRPFPGRVYRGGTGDELRIARRIADDVVEFFTGVRGVASTEIAYVASSGSAREIHVMDADGGNPRAATRNRSINNFPDWAPDGRSIVYSSYREAGSPALFLLTRGRPSPGRILRGLGVGPIYRGVFDPGGRRLALVVGGADGSEIYTVGRDGRALRRLTRNRAIEVSPSWSPDGRHLAFVSDRAGSPQIYLMDQDGRRVRRLTFEGSYNTDPAWSPDGRWIAYQRRVGTGFDIWITDPEGRVNVPVVDHPRSDEAPSWSPDSRKLVFASNRRGSYDLYAVNLDGRGLVRLTRDPGDETAPDWGPYPE